MAILRDNQDSKVLRSVDGSVYKDNGDDMILVYDTTLYGDTPYNDGKTILLEGRATNNNFIIYWGDGQYTSIEENSSYDSYIHTYDSSGIYTVRIKVNLHKGGSFSFYSYYLNTARKLIEIKQFGRTNPSIIQNSFKGCSSLNITASDGIESIGINTTSSMFKGCSSLKSLHIPNFNMSNIVNTTNMFNGCLLLNLDVSKFDMSNVVNPYYMFMNCNIFNANLDNWDTSKFANVSGMFEGCAKFTRDISQWNVDAVIVMNNLFKDAILFNVNLDNWNFDNVVYMNSMLYNAQSYNQSLASWNISNVRHMSNMLNDSGLDVVNYSNTLIGWADLAANSGVQLNVVLGANNLKYNDDGEIARQYLIDNFDWVITGDSHE